MSDLGADKIRYFKERRGWLSSRDSRDSKNKNFEDSLSWVARAEPKNNECGMTVAPMIPMAVHW
jgi:hypothetical protein